MPKGPRGEKRPADAIGAAIRVARIATGEEPETIEDDGKDKNAQALGRKGGTLQEADCCRNVDKRLKKEPRCRSYG